jgi:hypothetical protein
MSVMKHFLISEHFKQEPYLINFIVVLVKRLKLGCLHPVACTRSGSGK